MEIFPAPLRRAVASALALVPPSIWKKFDGLPGISRHPEIAAAKFIELMRLDNRGDVYRRLVSAWTGAEPLGAGARPAVDMLIRPPVAADAPPLVVRPAVTRV